MLFIFFTYLVNCILLYIFLIYFTIIFNQVNDMLHIFCEMLFCRYITYVKKTAFLACHQKILQHVNNLSRVTHCFGQVHGAANYNMYN